MDQLITVQFGSRLVPLKLSTIQAWFPVWGDGLQSRIDANPLVDNVAQRISGRILGVSVYNSGQEVERELGSLFQELSPRHPREFGEESNRQRVVEMMHRSLNSERYRPSGTSLPQSRSRFLILCLVANQTISNRLAEALLQFYNAHGQQIAGFERPTALHEWNKALDELQDLVSTGAIDNARQCTTGPGSGTMGGFQRVGLYGQRGAGLMGFTYEALRSPPLDGYFGRSGLGVPMHTDWSSRELSLLPDLHQFKSVYFIDIPVHGSSSLVTPLHSSASMDEVNRLQIRQAELAGEMNGMRRHIELMRGGWRGVEFSPSSHLL